MADPLYDCIRVDDMDAATVQACTHMAEQLHIDTCFLATQYNSKKDLQTLQETIKQLETTVNIRTGAVIEEKKQQALTKQVKSAREHADLVMVIGGEVKIHHQACRMPEVDVIDTPYYQRKDSGMDHVLAQTAAANSVAIGCNFNAVQYTYGKRRMFALEHMQTLIDLCRKYRTPHMCYSAARSPWDMHSPRDMAALLYMLGMPVEEALHAVTSYPAAICERSATVNLQDFVRPGIQKGSP